jgi:hypothetical protein
MTEPEREQITAEVAQVFVAQLHQDMAAGVETSGAFMVLAIMGRLRDAPPAAFTEQAVLQAEREGQTCLHHAARNGELTILPAGFRTQRYLSIADKFGRTLFHEAAEYGHLDQVPQELLTEENLMLPNCWGYCAVQMAVDHGHLEQIPPGLATAEKLAVAAAQRNQIFSIRKS